MYGHDQVVGILLGKGADVNSGDTYGQTPLFYATKNGHANVVRVLLDYEKGIDIAPEILVEAAIASREKKEDKTILELLLDRAGQVYISEEIVEIAVSKYFFCFIIPFLR
jgi:ankyrin repeat protein